MSGMGPRARNSRCLLHCPVGNHLLLRGYGKRGRTRLSPERLIVHARSLPGKLLGSLKKYTTGCRSFWHRRRMRHGWSLARAGLNLCWIFCRGAQLLSLHITRFRRGSTRYGIMNRRMSSRLRRTMYNANLAILPPPGPDKPIHKCKNKVPPQALTGYEITIRTSTLLFQYRFREGPFAPTPSTKMI